METSLNRPSTAGFNVNRVTQSGIKSDSQSQWQSLGDTLAVEEPLEIQIRFGLETNRIKKNLSITMRTPGNDFDLAVGFLFTEGIVRDRRDVGGVEFCGPTRNVVKVELASDVTIDLQRLERHFYTSSSCGVCGKSSIEALQVLKKPLYEDDEENRTDGATSLDRIKKFSVPPALIHGLPEKLRAQQGLFESTGGLHACALFDDEGRLLLVREDVGRHNALDKLIGHLFLNEKLPLKKSILLVSGRASFELVQKAAMAGIKFFAAVGAPSSLAVELAQSTDMTLLGFVRENRFNIYTGQKRVQA